jgi:hypothetical protein
MQVHDQPWHWRSPGDAGVHRHRAAWTSDTAGLLYGAFSLCQKGSHWDPCNPSGTYYYSHSLHQVPLPLPLSIKAAEEKLGVRPSISQFVIPLGATINMNGTALYQSVAAVFLAQVFGIELSFGALLLLMITVVGFHRNLRPLVWESSSLRSY